MRLTSEFLAGGDVVREPAGEGKGYWVGAPGAFYEPDERTVYLTYRVRRPRGVPPDRGGEAFIARSDDGVRFEDVLRVPKAHFDSPSIERCALRRGVDGTWRYFVSYVDPGDGRWCVSVLKAPRIEQLDPAGAACIFRAADLGLEGVKDPWIFEHDGTFHMMLSVAVPTPETSADSHATADIYNTGECRSATGLAAGADLDHWTWQGLVFEPGRSGWDRYARRINSVLRRGGRFIAFYDGAADHLGNYEERTGLAESADLRTWRTTTPDGPALVSPHAGGSLRYVDVLTTEKDLLLYYEFARDDGSHDLRVARVDPGTLSI
ncbi:MAG TPA: hypothetical protein VMZ92_09875 [Planctomycetota bacterium]|nr:hypothetical protein [Planctomycetota bacterium]